MTFFLKETPQTRRGPNIELPSNLDGISAAASSYWREVNVFGLRKRQVDFETQNTAEPAARRLGIDKLNAEYQSSSAGYDHVRTAPKTVDEFFSMHGREASDIALRLARDAALADPKAWADLDLSEEGIEARVTEQRIADEAADALDLALSPNPVLNSFVGQLGAAVMDPVNLALMPLGGGGGSLLRIMGREAFLGAVAEGIQYPTRTRTAEELGKPAPDLGEALAIGALGGAIFGGVIEAVPRGIRAYRYWQELKKARPAPTVSTVTQEVAVREAEAALTAGENPLDAVRKVLADEPFPQREPLILEPAYRVTPEPTPLAPDPITSEPLPPTPGQAPANPQETAALAGQALDEAQAMLDASLKGKKGQELKAPFLYALRKSGVQIDPNSPIGQSLKAMGINARSMPGFFSKTRKPGSKGLDNLVASEWDESFPGIWDATGTPRDVADPYLDPEGILDVLRREAAGDHAWQRQVADARALDNAAMDEIRGYDPQDAYVAAQPADDGFFVDLNESGFMSNSEWSALVGRGLEDYLARKGFTLLDREKAEILDQLVQRGGDGEYLVERAMERSLSEWEYAELRALRGETDDGIREEIPWGGPDEVAGVPDRTGGSPAGEPEPAARGEGGSGATAGEPANIERTDAGEQFVAPGAARIAPDRSARQKAEMEARQLKSKIRRLDQVRVEDDANSLFAAHQATMFDDLTSPEAQAFMDAEVAAMRADTEGDFSAVADDGRRLDSLKDILDEIDEADAVLREFQKCRAGDMGDTE